MKKLSVVIASLLLIIATTNSFAETASDSSAMNESIAKTSSTSSRLKNPKEPKAPLKAFVKTNREDFKERIASSQAAFKEKLATIKDEKKQQIVENINERLQTINQNRTDQFINALERLTNLLANFKMASTNERLQGTDKTALLKQIANAEEEIADAQEAVSTQAENDYILTIEDEETLRQTIGQTISQFKKDIVATHQAVAEARQAVRKVASVLAKLKIPVDTATISGQ